MKVAFKISIGSLVCMLGGIITNYIALNNTIEQAISSNWINILCFSIVGIGSLGIGLADQHK
jgi:hypothetical protein